MRRDFSMRKVLALLALATLGHAPTVLADAEPPQITLTAPQEAATVDCFVRVMGTATDSEGVVQLLVLDAKGHRLAFRDPQGATTYPFDLNVAVGHLPEGPNTLRVQARDRSWNLATYSLGVLRSSVVCMPIAVIDAPEPGAQVRGLLRATGHVEHPPEGTNDSYYLMFTVDGGPAQSLRDHVGDSWSLEWDTSGLADGAHTLTVWSVGYFNGLGPKAALSFETVNHVPGIETFGGSGIVRCSAAVGPVRTVDHCGREWYVTVWVGPFITSFEVALSWEAGPVSAIDDLGMRVSIAGAHWLVEGDGEDAVLSVGPPPAGHHTTAVSPLTVFVWASSELGANVAWDQPFTVTVNVVYNGAQP